MTEAEERKAKEAEVESAIRFTNDLLSGRIRPENVPEEPARGRKPMSSNFSRERHVPEPPPPPRGDCWASEYEIWRQSRERYQEWWRRFNRGKR